MKVVDIPSHQLTWKCFPGPDVASVGWRSSRRRGPPAAALREFFPTSTPSPALPDVRATVPTSLILSLLQPSVALLHLLCFLSWPLRGIPWPPRDLASPTSPTSCHGPCVAFRGPRVALLHLPCFLSWPPRCIPWPPRGLASPTLLTVMAPAWHSVAPAWPCFAYFAFCHGPCVALLHPLCFLS